MATYKLTCIRKEQTVASGRDNRSLSLPGFQKMLRKGMMFSVLWSVSVCASFWNPLLSQNLEISEICAANETVLKDPDFGKYADWIELYNPTDEAIDLSTYYLTDNRKKLFKWKFPENTVIQHRAYLIVFADDKDTILHASFKLAKEGEFIGLFAADSSVVDSFSFPVQVSDVSFGRHPDKKGTLQFFDLPTPSQANSTIGFSGVMKPPEFSHEPGIYQHPFYFNVNKQQPGDTILFTDDGSNPSRISNHFKDSILISKTTVINAFTVKNNFIPSSLQTATFVVRENPNFLPVVSISTAPANLFSDTSGIYVVGNNGSTGYCDNIRKRNYCQDWERPAYFEYFDENGTRQVAMPVGIKIHGNCSRNAPQKSLAIFARKRYGKGKISYPLFKDKPHLTEFEAVILRNAGNDNNRSLIRDGLTTRIIHEKMDIDWQAYQPVTVYLNGMYWGIMNLREKLNEHYLASNHNIDAETIDYLEEKAKVRYGSSHSFLELMEYLKTVNLSDESNYQMVVEQIDIESYINYMITQIYVGNTDWPRTNWRHWRKRSPEGKWRWVLYDTDFGFGLTPNSLNHNTVEHATRTLTPENPFEPSGAFIFNKLLESETFREQFLNTFLHHLETTFHPEQVLPVVDSLVKEIEKEIPLHAQRWRMDMEAWNKEIQTIRRFVAERHNIVLGHLEQFFENDLAIDTSISYMHRNTE